MNPRIAVLLAGYNGKDYILEQIFSLLWQRDVDVDVFIRIDGDCPFFRSTLIDLSNVYPNLFILDGDVVSSSASNFFNLILGFDYGVYDYYAFSDQDDIWCPDKIINSLSYFKGAFPQGYSSGLTAFYENGKTLQQSLGSFCKYDYFFQAGGAGCTYVLNSLGFTFLSNFLNEHKSLQRVSAHDWLIYFIFRINGLRWSFGQESDLYYRQHSSNVAGINYGLLAKVKRLNPLFRGWFFNVLSILIKFSSSQDILPIFLNPFNIRRSYLSSFFMWLYYWFYFRILIGVKNN